MNPRFDRPIFIVAPPRAGAALLRDTLAKAPGVWTLPGESPAALDGTVLDRMRDRNGQPPPAGAHGLRLLQASPADALRVASLATEFPDAFFVYVFRDPGAAPSGAEAEAWETTTRRLLDDLEALPPERWCVVGYDALVENPQPEIERLCRFLGLAWDRPLAAPLAPETRADAETGGRQTADAGGSPPEGISQVQRARDLFARPPKVTPPEGAAAPLRSVHTTSFPQLLAQLGASLLVSTYQSGHVVVLRADGGTLNTHFRSFRSPMGLALGPRSLAIGTERQVWLYRNVPAATGQFSPPGKHDACFLPYLAHVTGDIRVHELAFAGEELWLVNTRFSSLCTLDAQHSFVPRWRPPFVSALAPDDRCHLNGLAVVDGQPRYVTAHGRTDSPDGWRERKARGGVLLDVPSGEVVAAELSMPHSPRWHGGRLWALESGAGTLARVDLDRGRLETVARLPGFTRGLACAGPVAFVGLSQVRESNVFGGIPLTDSSEPRFCGVWAVHLDTGAVLGFVRFEDAVQEIFDVQLLSGLRFPELGEPESDLIASTFVLPPAALAEVQLRKTN